MYCPTYPLAPGGKVLRNPLQYTIERGLTRNKHWLIILAPTVKMIAPQNIVATKVAELMDYMNRFGPLNG